MEYFVLENNMPQITYAIKYDRGGSVWYKSRRLGQKQEGLNVDVAERPYYCMRGDRVSSCAAYLC